MTRHSSASVRPAARRQAGQGLVYAALAGDISVALIKYWAAHHTGSSAMLSEGVHSTVDALTELLLLHGLRTARLPSTADHPIGFGRAVFFWNFIVAMVILALGAGVALFDGLHQVATPRPIESPLVSYAVLLVAFVADCGALSLAIRNVREKRGRQTPWQFLRFSRDATLLTVLFSGASGVVGLVVAAAGTFLSVRTGQPVYDGVASITIAAILAVTALLLANASKSLLIGVPASPAKVEAILGLASTDPAVRRANGALTVHIGPDQILVALSVAFKPGLSTEILEEATVRLQATIVAVHPEIVAFLIRPENTDHYLSIMRARGW